jgi:hypothetical protein
MFKTLKTRSARMAVLFHVTAKSSNAKTGPIPVTTSSAELCPVSCPFRESGCYADGGPLALHWRKVTSGLRGLSWDAFLAVVRCFPTGQLWRHNQAGDLPGDGTRLDGVLCGALAQAAQHTRGFTYTHYPMAENRSSGHGPLVSEKTAAHNRAIVADMNSTGGLIVNASANNPAHVDALIAAGVRGPICTVLPAECAPVGNATPAGVRIVICPAASGRAPSCDVCQLCQRASHAVVGFPAHGARHRLASITASDGAVATC